MEIILLVLFRSSTPVTRPIITTVEAPPSIPFPEVRVAIKSMKLGTDPDLILYQETFFGLVAVPFMRISRTLYEAQPQKQAGFPQELTCMDRMQTVTA
ncbi:hypothetical protein RB195_006449 [Necator americanus]|uniref:Uncharacterized protein n=1 Tax=Necator americanus TaxID=51031 RepID=A0ABR1BSQ0_NECAM